MRIGGRGSELIVEGDEADVATVERILKDYGQLFTEGRTPSANELRDAFKQIADNRTSSLRELLDGQKRINPAGRKQVTARGPNQKRYIEAIENHDLVFGIGPAGTGKCIAGDSLVLTDRGMVEIGALGAQTMPQDQAPIDITVHGLNGAESASHIYNGGEADTLRITTRFGFSIDATPEHPLLVFNPDGEFQWRRADELRTGDSLALRHGQKLFGDRTTIEFEYQPNGPQDRSSRPIHINELDTEFAYFMGALVGDGCLTARNRIILSSADKPIIEAFEGVAARLGLKIFPNGGDRPDDHVIASAQLYQLLTYLGMSTGQAHTKRIPHGILAAPEKIVAAFLRGLFDTDGTIEKLDGLVTLTSVSETLIRETQIVLLNFGIVSSKSVKRGKYKGEAHISHMLAIAGVEADRFHEMIGFTLERKRDRRQSRIHNSNVDVVPCMGTLIDAAVRSATLTHAEHQLLFAPITNIEHSRARVYDLTVPGTHSFVANGFINHNTYLAVAMAVQFLMAKRVNRIILARPAVEAGEKLGFLPGDLQDKVDPYLRPLYDALFDLIDYERATKFLEKRVIEVAPLAFMRGRSLSLDSLLMTPNGWQKMGEIKVGDFVIGSDGKPVEVLGVYPQGTKQVYRLTMTDGASVVACAEHLWQVKTMEDKRRNKPPRIVETQEMIGNFRRYHQYRYELPLLSAPVEWPYKAVPIEPYALGILVGDGCISDHSSPSFTTSDEELISSLDFAFADMDLTIRRRSKFDYLITIPMTENGRTAFRNQLTPKLRELKIAGTISSTKFIPKNYLYNSAEVRIAVLQGLLDTDGGPATQEGRTCRIQYSTTSERLKDDLIFLVRSLGGVVYWRKRKAEGRKPGFAKGRPVPYRADVFVLNIRLPENIKPFRLRRKAEIYERIGGGRPMRCIKNIEYVGEAETQCIRVAAPDSLYLTDDFILTHNTLADAFIILDEAQNTTSEQMKMFLTRIGFGSKAVITGDVTQIDLPSGRKSGLVEARRVVNGIEGIVFIDFDERDVVRHHLVQMIVKAYDEHNKKINI